MPHTTSPVTTTTRVSIPESWDDEEFVTPSSAANVNAPKNEAGCFAILHEIPTAPNIAQRPPPAEETPTPPGSEIPKSAPWEFPVRMGRNLGSAIRKFPREFPVHPSPTLPFPEKGRTKSMPDDPTMTPGDVARLRQKREIARRQKAAEENAARANPTPHTSLSRAEMKRVISVAFTLANAAVKPLQPPKPPKYGSQNDVFAANIVAKYIRSGPLRMHVIAYRGNLALFDGITFNDIIERLLVFGLHEVRPKPRGRERRYDLSAADTAAVRAALRRHLSAANYAPIADSLLEAAKQCPKK
jgi:hypothetical protein